MTASRVDKLDRLDSQLIELIISGRSNAQMAKLTRRPLSTIQRRTRRLLEGGLIKINYQLDYRNLGYKIGLLHIYMTNGDSHQTAEKIASLKPIISVSLHIGNSDIIAEYAVKSSGELLELMAKIKGISSVSKIVWSEEVESIAVAPKLVG